VYQPVLPLQSGGRMVTGCKAHLALSKKAAIEGTVLLKNDGTLPLPAGSRVCLFGRAAGDFIFGGGGSGMVYSGKRVTLADGLLDADARGDICLFKPAIDFYIEKNREEYAEAKDLAPLDFKTWMRYNKRIPPLLPEALYRQAVDFGGTAIFTIVRFSSEDSRHGDRDPESFELMDEEKILLERLCQDFQSVIVVLNTCGPVATALYRDDPRIGALLYPLYGGSMSGEVITDILLGKAYPSGHLQTSLAESIYDYPSTESILESREFADYTEDIFVGYRYFETFCPEKVVYPFGFGLGFTDFSIQKKHTLRKGTRITLTATVTNTGRFAGKEVVQAYLTAPQGKLGKPKKVLCAFAKTRELAAGESCEVRLSFDLKDFASFDDLGKIQKSAFLLEQGTYTVHVGSNVRDTEEFFTFDLPRDQICRQCSAYMAPRALDHRLCADGTMEKLPRAEKPLFVPRFDHEPAVAEPAFISLAQALEENRLEEFMASLTDADLAELLYGHPMMNASTTCGIGISPRSRHDLHKIPLIPTADGPAGLRLSPDSGKLTTFFPCANTVSQSWDPRLARQIAVAIGKEVKENNIGIWLAPALNIQRSPLCGRNFEYYSEDPLISGLFAAECVKGVQSQNIAATVKHFCGNNKELNRKQSDSRISERALREIYLKGFEIVIRDADPWALMTAYNKVNGERSSSNPDAIGGILRGEWGYQGLIMTDWNAFSYAEEEIAVGANVKMPELLSLDDPNFDRNYDFTGRVLSGAIDRRAVRAAARRVLQFMDHFE
jgi:beta-glucosidase